MFAQPSANHNFTNGTDRVRKVRVEEDSFIIKANYISNDRYFRELVIAPWHCPQKKNGG